MPNTQVLSAVRGEHALPGGVTENAMGLAQWLLIGMYAVTDGRSRTWLPFVDVPLQLERCWEISMVPRKGDTHRSRRVHNSGYEFFTIHFRT